MMKMEEINIDKKYMNNFPLSIELPKTIYAPTINNIKFVFYSGTPQNIWVIEISSDGIKFNRDFFPNVSEDGFAQAFIDIL